MLNLSQEMIRAKPNSIRWDEINHIKYKFQAFNLPRDLLENLVLSSPPLARRERASTSPERKIPSLVTTVSETAAARRLHNSYKSASLDESQLTRGKEPKRKLSVVDAPSMNSDMSTVKTCDSISEQQECEQDDTSNDTPVCSDDQNNKRNDVCPTLSSVDITTMKSVAEPSDTMETTREHTSSRFTQPETDSLATTHSTRRPLKKCLSCIHEEDDLLGKSKEQLITIIRQLQRQTHCKSCESSRLQVNLNNTECPEVQLTSSIPTKLSNQDCSRGTQTSPEDLSALINKSMTKKSSIEKIHLAISQTDNKVTIPNQLDVLQSEVQKVYTVSSLFNNELASVQARLSNLILKSEGLSQGFKIMAKESQLDLNHISLNKKISVEGMHSLNIINTDC